MTAIPNVVDIESSPSLGQETATETVTVKDDQTGSGDDVVSLIKEEDDAVNFNESSSSVGFSKLHEIGLTPFLRKTFEIVDDAVTDPIVSWSPTRKSLIIWDSYEFSESLLPKYFKHKNFSSFVRQLNTYGFKKVDSDRWEFANEGFQGGKKHLLKNIKRRSTTNCNKEASTTRLKTEVEVKSLKEDQSPMTLEVLKLKQQQEESHHQVVTVHEKIHGVESEQRHMLSFFANLAKEQRFVERLVKKRKMNQQRDLEATELVKKLKLLQDQETQKNLEDVESHLIIKEFMAMAATQPDPTPDISMNNQSGNTRCHLNTEELLVDGGSMGGNKTDVDVNERIGLSKTCSIALEKVQNSMLYPELP